MTFSPELKLALDCCRRNFGGAANEPVAPPPGLDWSAFLRLVRFHRIEGLAWKSLSGLDMPSEVRTSLSEGASAIAAQNLHALKESSGLLELFDAAHVPLLFLKGLTVGALAYGSPGIKSAIDVDLLIDPHHLGEAADLLRSAGYALLAPRESPNHSILHAWHVGWKESVWAKASPPVHIDLHTRTADNARLISTIDVHSPRQWVDVAPEIRLPTLAEDELFAYLAVHGASSAWFRLKWIADFAGFLEGRSGSVIDRLYRRSQQLGAGRAAGQALLLADRLFGTLQPAPELRATLMGERATRWLFRAAFRLVTSEPREPTEARGRALTIHWTQLLLLPEIGFKLSELRRQASRLSSPLR